VISHEWAWSIATTASVTAYPPELALLSHLAPKTTLAIIKVPAARAVAIALCATPSRAAPINAHDEKGT
jgi:hypothetical protein